MHPTVRAAIEAVGQDLTKVECPRSRRGHFRASLLVKGDEEVDTGLRPEPMEDVSLAISRRQTTSPGQPAVFASPWGALRESTCR